MNNNSIFHNWTPKELEALKRATAKLRAKQPISKRGLVRGAIRENAPCRVVRSKEIFKGQSTW